MKARGGVGSQVSCFPKTIQSHDGGFIPICVVPSELTAVRGGCLTWSIMFRASSTSLSCDSVSMV